MCVPQSQTSVLSGLSCQDMRKFSTLLSAVVTTSWPRHQGTAVDGLEEVLKHLLICPDAQHICKLLGMWGCQAGEAAGRNGRGVPGSDRKSRQAGSRPLLSHGTV